MIKNRTVKLRSGPQIAASETTVAHDCWIAPAPGEIVSVKGWIRAKTGTNAAQLNLYKSGAAGSPASASTTAVLEAAMDMTSDTVVIGTLSQNTSNRRFIAGEVIYMKATTGATTTMDDAVITMEVKM